MACCSKPAPSISSDRRQHTELNRISPFPNRCKSFLKDRVEERGGAEDSLDHGIYRAVKEQASSAGLTYDAAAPAY